jgi:LPXTG-motif cell wall-anchored protein
MKRILGALMGAVVLLAVPTAIHATGYGVVPPTLTASNANPQAGAPETYTASGFDPGSTVTFTITGDSTVTIGAALANAAGVAVIDDTAPPQPGVYTVTATSGAKSSSTVITVSGGEVGANPPGTNPAAPGVPNDGADGLPATGTDTVNWLQVGLALGLTGAALLGVATYRRRTRPA